MVQNTPKVDAGSSPATGTSLRTAESIMGYPVKIKPHIASNLLTRHLVLCTTEASWVILENDYSHTRLLVGTTLVIHYVIDS